MLWKLNLTQVICLWMGKTTEAKSHRVNLRSPLSRIHYYQNKCLQVKESQYLIPTYSWTLTPIHNWTCNVVTILLSMYRSKYVTNQSMYGSQYVTNTPTCERCWLQSSLVHLHDEDQEAYWLQNSRHTTVVASSRERWTRANCLMSQYAWIKPLHQVEMALKIILIYI